MVRNKKKIIRTVTVPNSIVFFEDIMMQMNADGYETIVVTSPGKELDDFRHRYPKERVIEVLMERRISLIKDIISLWLMIKVLIKEKPYIVHSMTPKAGLITMLAARLVNVPVRIHTFTGLVWPSAKGVKRKILMAADWLICACASHIIPEGQGVLNDLKNHNICRKHMRVLGFGNVKGVDMERFDPYRFANVHKDKQVFRFIYVGRIVGEKGINELVEAFIRLNTEYPSTKLILVGKYEANLDPVKSKTLKSIEENLNIEVCGPKYDDALLMEYMKSDSFVLPSYREGFPNTVLEAGAMGLPSIVTNVNGSREIIIHEENGIIVPTKDVDALYDAMKRMLLDVALYKKMVSNARPLIEARFEKKFVQKCALEYYDEILSYM